MRRDDLVDLNAFTVVAEERSFTRAATRLGTSQSSLSYTIRRLEQRLGLRLLTRTTRNVAPTEAGERLLATLKPALDNIGEELIRLTELRDRPSGKIRLTTSAHAVDTVLWPRLKPFLKTYPEIELELSIDNGMADIVSDRFDAGVRLGEAIARDMIAVKIGPDLRMAVIGSPAYFDGRKLPKIPADLANHQCINLRFKSSGGLYAWDLVKDGREINVRVEGPVIVNESRMVVQAALDGFGLGYVMENQVTEHLKNGMLVRVLEDWCPPFSGYHLYYPNRLQPSAAFSRMVETLRYTDRGKARKNEP